MPPCSPPEGQHRCAVGRSSICDVVGRSLCPQRVRDHPSPRTARCLRYEDRPGKFLEPFPSRPPAPPAPPIPPSTPRPGQAITPGQGPESTNTQEQAQNRRSSVGGPDREHLRAPWSPELGRRVCPSPARGPLTQRLQSCPGQPAPRTSTSHCPRSPALGAEEEVTEVPSPGSWKILLGKTGSRHRMVGEPRSLVLGLGLRDLGRVILCLSVLARHTVTSTQGHVRW